MSEPSPESLSEATRLAPCNCPAKDEPTKAHAHYCPVQFQQDIALALDRADRVGAERARREDWRPIETAPRDGTEVWGWEDDRGSNPMVWVDDGGWFITFSDEGANPRLWQPLPDPPAILSSPAPGGETGAA